MKKEFGFFPERLEIIVGPVAICTSPELESKVASVVECSDVEDGWVYAPIQQTRDLLSGRIRTRPYSARVFGLPKTHWMEHGAGNEEQVDFLVWILSFFLGMRLTTTDAGFLDGTPVRPRKLVDFVLIGSALERAIELAETFWVKNIDRPHNTQLLVAAVHALFLGQYRRALEFERFSYLYTATDACFALTKELRGLNGPRTHAERIEWMCAVLGVPTPSWARRTGVDSTVVSELRNDAVHEALFIDEPLGFAALGGQIEGNLTLEMAALVSRLVVALLGGKDSQYLSSPVNTGQRQGLRLS